jgi:hypothetical protein
MSYLGRNHPKRGQRQIGQTTDNERQRIHTIRNNATIRRKASEAKGGSRDVGD